MLNDLVSWIPESAPEMVITLKVLPRLWLNVVLDEKSSLTIRNDSLAELRHADLAVIVA